MRKMISKHAKIRNLLNRVINGDERYEEVRAKIKAYHGEKRRINRFDDHTSDDAIHHKISQYLELVNDIHENIKELPVVKENETTVEKRQWAEGLVRNLSLYPCKGKDLQLMFAQIVFGHEKWLDAEIYQRNI